jgi:hypothetical protein
VHVIRDSVDRTGCPGTNHFALVQDDDDDDDDDGKTVDDFFKEVSSWLVVHLINPCFDNGAAVLPKKKPNGPVAVCVGILLPPLNSSCFYFLACSSL